MTGSVDPNGAATTYNVEFGTNRAYGKSSLPASAGAIARSVAAPFPLCGKGRAAGDDAGTRQDHHEGDRQTGRESGRPAVSSGHEAVLLR